MTAQTKSASHLARVTRTFAAEPERVFRAWTDEEALSRWFAPNLEMTVHVDELEPMEGGSYRIEMRHQNGNVYTLQGTFREVDPPDRLVLSASWEEMEMAETELVVELEAADGGTELTLTHRGFTEADLAAEHETGWAGCLWRLDEFLEPTPRHQLASALALNTRLFANALEEISEKEATERLTETTNHLLWVAGHLANQRAVMTRVLGGEPGEEMAAFAEAIDAEAEYPSLEDVEEYFAAVTADLRERIQRASDEQLAAPSQIEVPLNDPTTAGTVHFLLHQESYHLGQLGFLRKAYGHEALRFD